MAAYRAEIEIGVRGIRQLQDTTKQIDLLSKGVDGVNKRFSGAIQSLNAYNTNLARAAATLNKVNAGTVAEADAVRQYVAALGQANAARDRQNKLIQQQIALQRKAVPTANAGFGVQGPALPPAAGGGTRGGRGIGGRIGGAVSGSIIGGAFPLLFGQGGGAATGGAIGGLVGGLAGPGGSFAGSLLGTLLGDIASKGQAVKQLAEDIGFSAEQTKILEQSFKQAGQEFEKFELSVQAIRGVGLAINDQASAIQAASQLAEAYGGKIDKITNAFASALSAGKVTQATLNQLTQQGIPIQEKLAAKYGVSRSELLAMAKDGEISVQTLADAFVDLANQSAGSAAEIPSAYETASRQIQQSVNDLVTKVTAAFNLQTTNMTRAFDNAVSAIGSAVSTLITRFTPLLELVANVASAFINLGAQAASALLSIPSYVNTVVGAVSMMIPGLSATLQLLQTIQAVTGGGGQKPRTAADFGRYAPGFMQQAVPQPIPRITVPSQIGPGGGGGGGKGAGAKPPEDRTAQLQADLNAMESMMVSQDGIRDALFEGNKELAIRLEYDKKVADITRDTAKALRGANYESERAVIRAQEIVRLKDAELERDDELRELTRDINDIITSIVVDLDMELLKLQAKTDEQKQALRFIEIENQLKERSIILTEKDKEAIRRKIAQVDKLKKEQETANNRAAELNEIYEGIAGQIAGGVGNAIDAIANNVDNLGDALKNIGKDIMAAVGKMLIFYALAQAFGALGGNDDKGVFSFLAKGFGFKGAKDGAYWSGGFQAFADGGLVTSPTMGLIGEGGEPEYVIPASKMRGAMQRYAGGARGASVIPGSGESSPAAAGGTATLVPIDVRYTVERINSVDYVTADQFQAGMAQAAEQGARRGEQRALTNIRQNTTTRRRLGL